MTAPRDRERRTAPRQRPAAAMPASRADLAGRVREFATLLVLSGTMLAGGGAGPGIDMMIELAGVILIAIVLVVPSGPLPAGARGAFALFGLIFAVVCVQLVPLPASVEPLLPGRATAHAIRAATGLAEVPVHLSLDPFRTRRSALSLIPAVALFLAVLRADDRERIRLAWLAVAAIFAGALLGMFQISSGAPYLYPTAHEGSAVGFLTNRNHDATLLVCGMFFVTALGRSRARTVSQRLLVAAAILFLGLCVVTTTSRAGTALMLPALLLSLLYLFGVGRRRFLLTTAGLIAVLATGWLLVSVNPMAHATFTRFGTSASDVRLDFWRDTIVAIGQYWPIGAGLGTFVPIYATVENLDIVNTTYANHAHNEYLELVLDCGVAGVVVILFYLILLVRNGVAAARRGDPVAHAAVAAIVAILLHSLVDYPLRMLTFSGLFGLLNALTLRPIRN